MSSKRPNILRRRSSPTCPPAPKKCRSVSLSQDIDVRLSLSSVRRRLIFDDEPEVPLLSIPDSPASSIQPLKLDDVTGQIAETVEEPDDRRADPAVLDIVAVVGVNGAVDETPRSPSDSDADSEPCLCDPLERSLFCVEMMATRRDGRRYCPVCNRDKTRTLAIGSPGEHSGGCEHTSGSMEETVLFTSIPGLHCDPKRFGNLRSPMLITEPRSPDFRVVYVPYDENVCRDVCETLDGPGTHVRIGRGAFGEVFQLPDRRTAAKRSTRVSEVHITAFVTGVIRARAQASAAIEGRSGVVMNLLASFACCLRHGITTARFVSGDLYHYEHWTPGEAANYHRVFCELGDAIRFLGLECHISHLDITPMNILVETDHFPPYHIERLILCDYSLSEPYPMYNGLCALVFQETRTVRLLPYSRYKLCESYHPAFRPIPLQKLVAANPQAVFPAGGNNRYCTAELCALANVVIFCLARAMDERGPATVRRLHENALFETASAACEAMESERATAYANACLVLMAKQLAYAQAVLGESVMEPAVEKAHRYVRDTFRSSWVEEFRVAHADSQRTMDVDRMAKNARRMRDNPAGSALLASAERALNIVLDRDLDVDPHTLFQA